MITDVASFAKQLKEEGIEVARKEGEIILSQARKQASEIENGAVESAKKRISEAEDEIKRLRQRSEAELKMVARDLILDVKRRIEEIATFLLSQKASNLLSTESVLKEALSELIKNQKQGRSWDLALSQATGKSIAESVVQNIFREHQAEVRLVEGLKVSGFELRDPKGGQVIEVTELSVAEAFRKIMSPDLEKLLDNPQFPKETNG
ncbi:hypothetical protein HYY75_04770 [bacterium]|nr:hypothetical protein [bacterium]